MQSFIIPQEVIPLINLYSLKKDNDDFSLIRLCKTAIEKNFASITVDMNFVGNVWKWIEHSNVKLVASINMITNMLSPTELFQNIKSVFENGADMVEIVMPLLFSNIDEEKPSDIIKEYLDIITEAKSFKQAKITFETGFIPYVSQIKYLTQLIQKHNIDIIKTASSFYEKASTINHFNLILNNIKNINTKIDFLFDVKSCNKFIISDAYRLVEKSPISERKPLIVSYPIECL